MHTETVVQFLALVLFELSYADPLQIVFTDQPSQIMVGSEVHLTCVVSGGSSPHTTWISPTGLLPPNSHMTNEGKTLVITHFDVTNNGQYICVTSDGFQFAHHVFTVILNSGTTTTTTPTTTRSTTHAHKTTHTAPRPPTILSTEVQPTNYHYGDDVELICRVESNPPSDQLGWNMMTDPSRIPANINLVYGTDMVKVHIKHLTAENIEQYQCFVQNSFGSDFQTLSLHPPK
ncbi:neuronal cell adhesion molecule [Magallana gigas]|uniref:neuronal cell adhesion molecule n=1 Tax=Magallana gigas TaxID=29159 RepID=UPI0033414E17